MNEIKQKDSFGLRQMSSEALKSKFRNGELEAVSDVTRDGAQEVRDPKTGKRFTIRIKNPNRNIVTSENREEFMAKKLKLGKKEEPVYEEEEEESYAPVAPVPARKYLIGTPEHKEAKAKQKPINGMPTNRRK